MSDYPTISLRAGVIPIELARIRPVAGPEGPGYDQEVDAAGNVLRETVGLVMTMNVLVEFEERYGGLVGWQKALDERPYTTVRDSIAACIGRDRQQVGESMLPGETKTYMAAVGAAFAIANGVDPTQAQEMLDKAKTMDVNAMLDGTVSPPAESPAPAATDSPSTPGLLPGFTPDAPTPSSGV